MMGELLNEIPGSYFFKDLQLIGGSSPLEQTYHVERKTGSPLLLTLSPCKEYERKKAEFRLDVYKRQSLYKPSFSICESTASLL